MIETFNNADSFPFPCPCRQCKERHIGCHDECEKYKKFREELDKANKAERDEKKKWEFGNRLSWNWKWRKK